MTPMTVTVSDTYQYRFIYFFCLSNASFPHEYQSTGLWVCWSKYGDFSVINLFGIGSPSFFSYSFTILYHIFFKKFIGTCCSRALNIKYGTIKKRLHKKPNSKEYLYILLFFIGINCFIQKSYYSRLNSICLPPFLSPLSFSHLLFELKSSSVHKPFFLRNFLILSGKSLFFSS